MTETTTMSRNPARYLAASFAGGLALAVAAVPATVTAQTATDTFVVRATVNSFCTMSAGDIDFGVYDPSSGSSATGSVLVRCTALTAYTIALDGGQSGNISQRRMAGAQSANLAYVLYTDAAHTTIWGDGSTGQTVAGTGSGSMQSYQVDGLIAAGQTPPAGAYTDTITATITY
jgi:spore coat protein U-like protein